MTSPKSLDEVKPGNCMCVVEVTGGDSLAARIMEMGIYEGEVVTVLGLAPMGDPMDLALEGSRLSLRKNEARRVKVVPLEGSKASVIASAIPAVRDQSSEALAPDPIELASAAPVSPQRSPTPE